MVLHAEESGPTRAARGGGDRPVSSARETKHGLSELVVLAARLGGFEWSRRRLERARRRSRRSRVRWDRASGPAAVVGQCALGGGSGCMLRARRRPRRSRRPSVAAGPRRHRHRGRPPAAAPLPSSLNSSSLPQRLTLLFLGPGVVAHRSRGGPRGLAIWLDRSSRRSEEVRQRRRDGAQPWD